MDNFTIGWGHLLEDMDIPDGVTRVGELLRSLCDLSLHEQWLQDDIAESIKIAHSFTSGRLETLSDARQEVIIELAFWIGNRLHNFVNFRAAALTDDHETAADEILDSKLATQVPDRTRELAGLYRAG